MVEMVKFISSLHFKRQIFEVKLSCTDLFKDNLLTCVCQVKEHKQCVCLLLFIFEQPKCRLSHQSLLGHKLGTRQLRLNKHMTNTISGFRGLYVSLIHVCSSVCVHTQSGCVLGKRHLLMCVNICGCVCLCIFGGYATSVICPTLPRQTAADDLHSFLISSIFSFALKAMLLHCT